jgi:hypothetical protein
VKITMLTTIPGTADGQWLREGFVVDINEQTATFLVAEGQAEPYPKPPPPEIRTAEVAPPRNAAQRTGKMKPRQRQKD